MKRPNITERTIRLVNSKRVGIPFGIEQLYQNASEGNNVSVTLNSLQKDGKVIKLGRGVYYKPEMSKYGLGPLPVQEKDIIAFVSKKYNGYMSGAYAFNLFGFTTQTATTICIATPTPQRPIKLGNYDFIFRKSYFGYEVGKESLKMLVFLDALTDSDRIPGIQSKDTLRTARIKLSSMIEEEIDEMIELSRYYPRRTRVRLYNILPDDNNRKTELKKTLSKYTQI